MNPMEALRLLITISQSKTYRRTLLSKVGIAVGGNDIQVTEETFLVN